MSEWDGDSWQDCDTGCYCRHWHDINDSDCEYVCKRCGHGCHKHNPESCGEPGCDCPSWVEGGERGGE